jgi:hypothetical protein
LSDLNKASIKKDIRDTVGNVIGGIRNNRGIGMVTELCLCCKWGDLIFQTYTVKNYE